MVDILLKRVDFLIAIFICLIILPGRLNAETDPEDYIVINRLTRQSGLPDQDVNRIYFDSKGYAWISTFDLRRRTCPVRRGFVHQVHGQDGSGIHQRLRQPVQ